MEQKDFLNQTNPMVEIKEALKEAEQDDTPFPVVTDDGVKVVGDANKIDKKIRNYSVRFRFPDDMFNNLNEKDIVKRVGRFVFVKLDFDNVTVAPNRDTKLMMAIVDVLPLFKKLDDSGNVSDMSVEDFAELFREVPQYAIDGMYTIVSAFLQVDDSIKDYMLMQDVIGTIKQLIKDFPETFNEADAFFG